MDDVQLYQVLLKRRDETGKLIRVGGDADLPDWVKVDSSGMRVLPKGTSPMSFRAIFDRANKHLSEEKREDAWSEFRMTQRINSMRMREDFSRNRM